MITTDLVPNPETTYQVVLPHWLKNCLIEDKNDQQNNLICRAFQFAYSLHEGQYRKSGEAYIAHPIVSLPP